MRSWFFSVFLLFPVLFLFLGGCGREVASPGDSRLSEGYVIALKPDKNPEAMLADKSALEAALEAILEASVEVIIPLSGAVIREGLANGTIDLAYLSSTEAVQFERVAELLLAGEIGGRPYYDSYWITTVDSPHQSVDDLRGRRVAFASRTSTSGFLIPIHDLVKRGLVELETGPEGFFGAGNVFYGTGYVSAVERVLSGDAEAAAVSYYVLDRDKHLSQEQWNRLRLLSVQGPVPSHTFCVRRTLGEEDRSILKNALLTLDRQRPELVDQLFSARIIEVDPEAHVIITREALDIIEKIRL